jgi:hypothetical protein
MAATALIEGMEQRFYRPQELRVDPAYDVRPWSTSNECEDTEVEALSFRIERDGQLDPVRVILREENPPRPIRGDKAVSESYYASVESSEVPVIYAGHRRVRATALLNARISSRGVGELVKVWCVIDRTGGDIRQKAFSSNWDRKNIGPMNVAMFIQQSLRKEFGPDAAGTKKIADYLGMSKSHVIQHERLLGGECSLGLRRMIQEGVVTMDGTLDILNAKVAGKPIPAEQQEAVIKRGKEIQDNDALERITDQTKTSMDTKMKSLDKALAKKRVEAPAIRKAIKELDPKAKVKRNMRDCKELTAAILSSLQNPDGQPGQAFGYLRKWLDGEGTNEEMIRLACECEG